MPFRYYDDAAGAAAMLPPLLPLFDMPLIFAMIIREATYIIFIF